MKSQSISSRITRVISLVSMISLFLLIFGCSGDNGAPGFNGTSFGTVAGTITDDFSPPNNVAGATVTPSPLPQGVSPATADAGGKYAISLPNGNYTFTFSRPGYVSQTQPVTVISAQTVTLNVTLVHSAAAAVNVANTKFVNGSATFTASVAVFDPKLKGQPVTFAWTDFAGNPVGTGPTITVPQPSTADMKALVANFMKVRMGLDTSGSNELADENDVDVPSLQPLDRFQVLAISQKAFENAANTPYTVTATIGDPALKQTFSAVPTASLPANTVPFVPNGGLRNVPIGQPVALQGFLNTRPLTTPPTPQTTYNWTITPPVGSNVTTLVDPTTRFPDFIPDAPGIYAVKETVSGQTMNIYAGSYVGILVPAANQDPRGILDVGCSSAGCHPATTFFNTPYNNGVQFFDTTAINTVFSEWKLSGHSVIMVKGMQEGSNYSLTSCAKCHSVGYSQFSGQISAGGFKDVAAAAGFTNATFLANTPNFFVGFDQVLRVSEVQCETCHGPNGGDVHATEVPDAVSARMSVASDVCGTCHGEPPRHGRFQEWVNSGHGDYETAMEEGLASGGVGVNPNCGGCHTGEGFPLWIIQLQAGNPSRTLNAANVTALSFLTADNVQPQTCSTCHIVHNPGTQPGLVGNVVILRGDYQPGGAHDGTTPLLPAGFLASGVGKGALCITCHNSRNGFVSGTTATLHEDGDPNFGLPLNPATLPPGGTLITSYSAPHEASQGDTLMGRNAYFFGGPEDTHNTLIPLPAQVGERSKHSLLADACVTCHLEKAPTDPALGYPPNIAGAGTNHTFAIVNDATRPADDQINNLCNQCHGNFQGTGVQNSFDATYFQMLVAIQNAIKRIHGDPASTNLTFIPGRSPQVSINGAVPVNLAIYLASAAGTAATGPIPASGFQIDLFKANWDASLVAPGYNATAGGTSYSNGTPILNSFGGTVSVAGDQSKSVHNPTFVNNVMAAVIFRMNQL